MWFWIGAARTGFVFGRTLGGRTRGDALRDGVTARSALADGIGGAAAGAGEGGGEAGKLWWMS